MKTTIIFDQYSRYKVCTDILNKLEINSGTILDVGSGEECILEDFLPQFNITFVDPLLALHPDRSNNKIADNVFSKELDNRLFDYVICVDTLEHIPPINRKSFLERICSLCKNGVILAVPCSDVGDALETDKWINDVYFFSFNKNYKWLQEHFESSLPTLSSIVDELRKSGFHTNVIQNGHTPWLRELLSFVICALEFNSGRAKVLELSEYFNKHLYKFDHQEPCYRQVILATKEKIIKSIAQKKINSQLKEEANRLWSFVQKRITSCLAEIAEKEFLNTQELQTKFERAVKDVDNLQKINLANSSNLATLQKSLKSKQMEIANLQEAVKSYQKTITDIHQSFVFRMLHKYDNTLGKIIPLRPKKYLKSSQEHLTDEEQASNKKKASELIEKKDILCFPIINWDFRYQRPQHIMSEFAKNGHRIFYFTVNLKKLTRPYEIKSISNNIFQVELSSPKFFDIYKDKFDKSLTENILKSFESFQQDLRLDAISFVQFPTWEPLVMELKKRFDYKIVFDCLDDFMGFGNVVKERNREEATLIKNADLVTATASSLIKKIMKNTSKSLFLPNAGEFAHFNKQSSERLLRDYKKPIVGYFGSIAQWFDNDLIEFVAQKRPHLTFVFIGHTFGLDIRKLSELKNVHFLGERPYSELPKYLQDFDICLIPFKDIPLIQATHPVKIYEYFSAGKPVVTTNMPELFSMRDLCYISENKEEFLAKLDLALKETDPDLERKRIEFASKNTWEHRFQKLYAKLNEIPSLNLAEHK